MKHPLPGILLIMVMPFGLFAGRQPKAPEPISVAPPFYVASAGAEPIDPGELESFIDAVMTSEMDANHIPGAVVAVVQDGRPIFEKGYGYSDLESATPVDPERTLFRVGSISKLFVWTAAMQLAEQGALSLDEDVNTYLDFRIPDTYPEPITMKHLMSHTAGFEGSDQGLWKRSAEEMGALQRYVKTYLPARVYPPGQIELYSNYGAALAAYIIEQISGISFSEYAERNILSPLGMSHSSFRQPLPAELASGLANGYHFSNGRYVQAGFEYVDAYPVGSLSSTADDMAKFMLAHLQNGRLGRNRILAEGTAELMHSQLFTHDPRISGMAYGFYENRINGQRVLCHGGGSINFYSKLCLMPDKNIGFFVSTNAAGGATAREVLFTKFMDGYFPAAPHAVMEPADGFATRVAPYLGTYYQAASNYSTAEKLLRLQTELTVSLDRDGRFFASIGDRRMQFVEVEPGLMRDLDTGNVEFVLQMDDHGQAYWLSPEPSPWVKTPWYGTASFHALLLGVGLLLFAVTTVSWAVSGVINARRHHSSSLFTRFARWTAGGFAFVLILVLAGWFSLLTELDPAFGASAVLFGLPPLYYVLYALTYVLAGLGILMLTWVVLSWVRRLWNLVGRLQYSLLTLSALSLLWMLCYWNLL